SVLGCDEVVGKDALDEQDVLPIERVVPLLFQLVEPLLIRSDRLRVHGRQRGDGGVREKPRQESTKRHEDSFRRLPALVDSWSDIRAPPFDSRGGDRSALRATSTIQIP